jgi:lipopolysaccharide transport system ATP-binding protein
MVEYYMKAPNCCELNSEGYQSGFGTAMNQDTNGFMGLEEVK